MPEAAGYWFPAVENPFQQYLEVIASPAPSSDAPAADSLSDDMIWEYVHEKLEYAHWAQDMTAEYEDIVRKFQIEDSKMSDLPGDVSQWPRYYSAFVDYFSAANADLRYLDADTIWTKDLSEDRQSLIVTMTRADVVLTLSYSLQTSQITEVSTRRNAILQSVTDSSVTAEHITLLNASLEEDLQTLRQRLNDWAARECPVLRTPPLECDLSVHLDRLTVESVRRLDQLAPYGADNPSPVFVLEMAVVEGVYAVSEGKHCRLRLRQGNSSIYAVWFGMHPEQVPYSTGDVVDAAISLSVYDSPRGAQLSGRIIELHPAGLGNTAAEQAALVQALRRGTPLTPEQKESIAPERSHIITVYRELQARRWHAEDLQPLFAKLGEENTGRTLVAVAALEQVGLITAADRGGAKFWELVPATGKKNLADAPILKCLEER